MKALRETTNLNVKKNRNLRHLLPVMSEKATKRRMDVFYPSRVKSQRMLELCFFRRKLLIVCFRINKYKYKGLLG